MKITPRLIGGSWHDTGSIEIIDILKGRHIMFFKRDKKNEVKSIQEMTLKELRQHKEVIFLIAGRAGEVERCFKVLLARGSTNSFDCLPDINIIWAYGDTKMVGDFAFPYHRTAVYSGYVEEEYCSKKYLKVYYKNKLVVDIEEHLFLKGKWYKDIESIALVLEAEKKVKEDTDKKTEDKNKEIRAVKEKEKLIEMLTLPDEKENE